MRPTKLLHADLARALGVVKSRITALKARGMPVEHIEAARTWCDQHLDPAASATG